MSMLRTVVLLNIFELLLRPVAQKGCNKIGTHEKNKLLKKVIY